MPTRRKNPGTSRGFCYQSTTRGVLYSPNPSQNAASFYSSDITSFFIRMDSSNKTALQIEVPFAEKVSRLFIFRFLWVYILWIPAIPIAIWVGIVTFVHFWYMLILGKRHQGMWTHAVRMLKWVTNWQSYLSAYTDARPGFWY